MRKLAASYPPKLALRPKSTTVGVRTLQPNMSRRTRDMTLYAFPSFDRCDSLLFFPSTLARHMNSGDIPAIVKLFEAHFDPSCTVVGRRGGYKGLNIPALTQKMQLMEELQPDRITCIRSTKVSNNVIKAVGFTKYTKCKDIDNAVLRVLRGANILTCDYSWQEHMRRKLDREDRPAQEKDQILSMVVRDCDLVVYSRIEMVLTIDDRTKKVKQFDFSFSVTSMEETKYDTTDQL